MENDQKVSELHLQKEQEDHNDKDKKVKDQMEKRMVKPLTLLKDDLLKVFTDKDAKTEREEMKSQTAEKNGDLLSLFKEDFSHFKDELSNVFRIGLSKEKDKKEGSKIKAEEEEETKKEEELNTKQNEVKPNRPEDSGIDAHVSEEKHKTQQSAEMLCTSNTDRPRHNLFRTDHKSETVMDSQRVNNMISEMKEEQMSFRETLTEQNKDDNLQDWVDQPEDSVLDMYLSETQKTEETMCTSSQTMASEDQKAAFIVEELQKESEICVQEEDLTNKGDVKGENVKMKDHLKTNQSEKRTNSPLSFLTEDWFKAVKVKHEENKATISTSTSRLRIQKDDMSLFKEDVISSKDKDVKSADPKTSIGRLNLLKDDIANVFRIGLSKEKDEIKVLKTDEPFKNLFRRDQKLPKTSEKVQDSHQATYMLTKKEEEQLDCGFREILSDNMRNRANESEDRKLNLSVSEETHFPEIQKIMSTSDTSKPTGFSSQTKSALVVEEPPQENHHQESGVCLRDLHLPEHKDEQDFLRLSQKRTISPLSVLREDFSHLKDDFLHVFRIGLSKDNKEDSKINVLKAKQKEEAFKRDKQLDCGFRGRISEKNGDTVNSETENNTTKDQLHSSEVGPETGFSEHEDTMCTSHTADDAKEKEDGPSEILPEDTPQIGLFGLRRADPKDNVRGQTEGDRDSPKNFATYLTFDPNTANSELLLNDDNRKATRVWSDHRPLDHPDRFECCPQVLCREGLLDCVYWEVEWSGGADIGIAYNSISRNGETASCLLGHNEQSWSLECSEGSYTPCYNNKRFRSSSPEPFTHTVGVYLDWSAGTLSFYCVSPDTMVHLHTFTSTFTEPLYAGFWIWAYEGSVSLCQVQMDWEQLE